MVNGQSKEPSLIFPPSVEEPPMPFVCHRMYAPMVIPEPDKFDPRKATILPRLGSFNCIKERCTIWNKEEQECRDVTDSKSRATLAQYAFNKINDVHIEQGGA